MYYGPLMITPLLCDDLETTCHILVCPADCHEVIYLWWTVDRGIHSLSTFNHLHDIVSLHSLWTVIHPDEMWYQQGRTAQWSFSDKIYKKTECNGWSLRLMTLPVPPNHCCNFSLCSEVYWCSFTISHLYKVKWSGILLVQVVPYHVEPCCIRHNSGQKWESCGVHRFFYNLVQAISLNWKS